MQTEPVWLTSHNSPIECQPPQGGPLSGRARFPRLPALPITAAAAACSTSADRGPRRLQCAGGPVQEGLPALLQCHQVAERPVVVILAVGRVETLQARFQRADLAADRQLP